MQDNSLWPVVLHDTFDDGFKDCFIRAIVNPVTKRKVDSIVFALTYANVAEFAGAREVFSVFVEGYSHDSICGIESLLNAITMVNVNIDVKHTLLEAKKLNNAEHNI